MCSAISCGDIERPIEGTWKAEANAAIMSMQDERDGGAGEREGGRRAVLWWVV